jgi:hypothetical protein
MQYYIWVVSPPGYVHSQAFDEIAIGLKSGIFKLGFEVPIVRKVKDIAGQAIVLGCHLIPQLGLSDIPQNFILFNLEQIQLESPWMSHSYFNILKSNTVWDYSYRNIRELEKLGIHNAIHCGIGYESELTKIHQTNEDIDVLLYGSLNARRIEILKELKKNGLNVVALFGTYGEDRDKYIARSKIILNIHYYEARVFEIIRVSYLLANKKFVISECGQDHDLEKPFAKGMVFSPYQGLVEKCMRYVRDESSRKEIAEKGFDLMKRRPQSAFLKQALAFALNGVTPSAERGDGKPF